MVIGLTGGIGTGKSTVSQILKDRGFPVLDLDVISHEVIEFSSVVEKIVQNFGREVLDEDEAGNCTISREKLGKIIFSDKKKRLALNSIMHPEILKVMHKKILECELGKNKKKNKIIFVEVQLLFEVQWEKEFDYILLVAAKRDMQVRRVLERDKRSEEEAWNIINSQMSLDEKREKRKERMNTLSDLNSKLFDQMDKLSKEGISEEELEKEISRSETYFYYHTKYLRGDKFPMGAGGRQRTHPLPSYWLCSPAQGQCSKGSNRSPQE